MNKVSAMLTGLTAAVLIVASASMAVAQQSYKSPDAAVDALVATAKSGDQKAALVVLGRDGKDIISSGDKVSDDAVRQRFVASYDAKHQITLDGADKAILVIGDNDYPFPIPLVRDKHGTWSFDTEAGRREILYRRIGHNELATIQTCLAYVDAQNDYAAKDRSGAGAGVYAERFISAPGKKDGLYWPTAQGEEESPLGELFAAATRQGYRAGEGRSPYHGYYYKILTKQGAGRRRRRGGLCGQRQNDRRLCACRLSGRVPQFGRDDIRGQSRRSGLPERPGAEDGAGAPKR